MGTKHLRATLPEDDFHRFKRIMSEIEAETNDEAIISLMDKYEKIQEAKEGQEAIEEND